MQTDENQNLICKALLLEKCDNDRKSIEHALQRSQTPFECSHAYSLAELNDIESNGPFDIILTDLDIADSSGLGTISALLERIPNTPIVVLSDINNDSTALEAVHAGAQDYIHKRYISDEALINRIIRHAIERHQLRQGLENIRDRERHLAHFDQCTNLPNRLLFFKRIQQAITQAKYFNEKFAIFFVDLDRFKQVNDSQGHSAGDEVLRNVGKRLSDLVRNSDTVARFGGDEFVIILQHIDHSEAMKSLATRMIAELNEPVTIDGHLCQIGASIGIATFPKHGNTAEELLKNADVAMYEAKKKGRNKYQFFNSILADQQFRIFSLEKSLRAALENPNHHFALNFQPRIQLSTGEIASVGALLRWNHPELGNIPPNHFIPLAEDLGLIERIDEWVLEATCQKALEWQTIGNHTRISINISSNSMARSHFVNQIVSNCLAKYAINGQSLEFEISENLLSQNDRKQVKSNLKALKVLGVDLTIDNFGKGFASLSFLNELPIDTLKIDGSFICDEQGTLKKKSLLKAIIALANELGLKVVAECIETEHQMSFLKGLSCDEGQGYYWCKPDPMWSPSPMAARQRMH